MKSAPICRARLEDGTYLKSMGFKEQAARGSCMIKEWLKIILFSLCFSRNRCNVRLGHVVPITPFPMPLITPRTRK